MIEGGKGMKHIRSFKHGGISLSGQTGRELPEISNAFLPNHALVALREHEFEAETEIIVHEGQEVCEGQLLAKALGRNAVNVHAPVPGIIRKQLSVQSTNGFVSRAIVISLVGKFNLAGYPAENKFWRTLNRNEILYILQDRGIIRTATGQALHRLVADHQQAASLLVNVLDMEVFSGFEASILNQYTAEVVKACAMLLQASTMTEVIFAVNAQAGDCRRLHAEAQANKLPYRIEYFSPRYPHFFPNQVAEALTGHKSGLSALFVEPSTLVATYQAINSNIPYLNQFVFLGGNALKQPSLLKVRLGTPIGKLIEECGGFVGTPDTIAVNNPLVNGYIEDLDMPVTKTTRALWLLTRPETRQSQQEVCMRCGNCIKACPERLNPYFMNTFIMAGQASLVTAQLERCSGCAACSYVCSSRIPLSVHFKQQQKAGATHEN
ncbi:MAG TPA: hypothetical protein DCX65_02555 [Spirochaetaceae bacterium]|nr:hypothetical protein [Spirochaetaceae bacterium]